MRRKGISHNDLKSSNILLKRVGGRIKFYLADFGLARMIEDIDLVPKEEQKPVLSMDWYAPEWNQWAKEDSYYKADVFSVGYALTQRSKYNKASLNAVLLGGFMNIYDAKYRPSIALSWQVYSSFEKKMHELTISAQEERLFATVSINEAQLWDKKEMIRTGPESFSFFLSAKEGDAVSVLIQNESGKVALEKDYEMAEKSSFAVNSAICSDVLVCANFTHFELRRYGNGQIICLSGFNSHSGFARKASMVGPAYDVSFEDMTNEQMRELLKEIYCDEQPSLANESAQNKA